jgi:hypothetical protein
MTDELTRRRLITAGGALIGLGAAAGLTFGFGLWQGPWATSPYNDLLGQLPLEAGAVTLGRAVRQALPTLNDTAAAASLRRRLAGTSLRKLARKDAEHRRVVEVSGWILPLSVAELCALAASKAEA